MNFLITSTVMMKTVLSVKVAQNWAQKVEKSFNTVRKIIRALQQIIF